MASRIAREVVEGCVQPGQSNTLGPEAVTDVVVAVRVRRQQHTVPTREPPVAVDPPKRQTNVRHLHLDVRLIDSIGTLVDEGIALSPLDHPTVRELRVIQVVVVPAHVEHTRNRRRLSPQLEIERRKELLIAFRPQDVAVCVAHRLEPNAGLGSEVDALGTPALQQLDLPVKLALDRVYPTPFLRR